MKTLFALLCKMVESGPRRYSSDKQISLLVWNPATWNLANLTNVIKTFLDIMKPTDYTSYRYFYDVNKLILNLQIKQLNDQLICIHLWSNMVLEVNPSKDIHNSQEGGILLDMCRTRMSNKPLSRKILASYVAPAQVETMSNILWLASETFCTLILWKFFLLRNSTSCSVGATIRTRVTSIASTTPGNLVMPKKSAWCFRMTSACIGNEMNRFKMWNWTRAFVILWMIRETVDWCKPKLTPLHYCILPVA